jgi:hypothetical protein
LTIANPELTARLGEARAARAVDAADLARIETATRPEIVAERRAQLASATAAAVLRQQTYDRVRELAQRGNAPLQSLDQRRRRWTPRCGVRTRPAPRSTRRWPAPRPRNAPCPGPRWARPRPPSPRCRRRSTS